MSNVGEFLKSSVSSLNAAPIKTIEVRLFSLNILISFSTVHVVCWIFESIIFEINGSVIAPSL